MMTSFFSVADQKMNRANFRNPSEFGLWTGPSSEALITAQIQIEES